MKVSEFIFIAIKPFKWHLMLGVFASIVWAVELSLKPYLIKCLIESAAINNEGTIYSNLLYYIGFYFFLTLFVASVETVHEYLWIRFIPSIRHPVCVEHF